MGNLTVHRERGWGRWRGEGGERRGRG